MIIVMKKIPLFISLLLLSSVSFAQQKPNIVIIVSDDHAFQTISAYGSKLMQTPNIDRIAKEGMIFNKAYVTNSICGPSRAVILTGKYSHKNGFKDNDHSRFDGNQDTFVKHLQSGGYQTAWIGKWHLGSNPEGFNYWQILPDQGDYYNPDFLMMDGSRKKTTGYVSNLIEDAAEEWMEKRDPSKPFCLVIGHKATHRSWMPDTTDMGRFEKQNFPMPANFYDAYLNREAAKVQDMTIDKTMTLGYDLKMLSYSKNGEPAVKRMNEAQRAKFEAYYQPVEADFKARALEGKALVEWKYQRYMKDYLSTAASLDRNIGRTLDYLDQHHLKENTIVVYLSDQGFYMGEHGWFDKRFMYEESFRTPMMMRYPGKIKPGSKSEDFVMNLDLAPTMLDAAGLAVPEEIQGKSFMPLLKGNPKAKGREAMYYHYYENTVHSVSPHFGVRTNRYKLIRFYERVNTWELYDLQKDPSEENNLFGKKGYDLITKELKGVLKAQILKYDDQEAAKLME